MAPDFTDAPPVRSRLSDAERLRLLDVIEAHGGTQLVYPCPVHGDEHLCAERVAAWNALAGAGLLPTVDDELAVGRRERN